jgi:ankyrin repeat protein
MASATERLSDAARAGDVARIAAALLAGADANAVVRTWTPLQWAAHHDHVAAISALLAAGTHVDGEDSEGWTPLMLAAYNGHTTAIGALLAAGADVHHANVFGEAPLHRASMSCQVDAARILLDAGARTDVRNDNGKRPIDVVRAQLARSLRLHDCVTPPRCIVQICGWASDKSSEPALLALFASAAPWSRRWPVAIACYGDAWEWEA